MLQSSFPRPSENKPPNSFYLVEIFQVWSSGKSGRLYAHWQLGLAIVNLIAIVNLAHKKRKIYFVSELSEAELSYEGVSNLQGFSGVSSLDPSLFLASQQHRSPLIIPFSFLELVLAVTFCSSLGYHMTSIDITPACLLTFRPTSAK